MTTAPKLEPWPYPGFTLDQIDEAVLRNDNISVALTEAILEATKRARAAPSAGLREVVIQECAKVAHAHREKGPWHGVELIVWRRACAQVEDAIRALSKDRGDSALLTLSKERGDSRSLRADDGAPPKA